MTDIYDDTIKTLKIRKRELELELRKLDAALSALTTDKPIKIHNKNQPKICIVCNTGFLAARKDAKFCSSTCQNKFRKKGITLIPGAQK